MKSLSGKSILWLEDEFQDCSRELKALETAGAQVEKAETLASAIEALRGNAVNFDLAILDVSVPAGAISRDIAALRRQAGIQGISKHNGFVAALWLKTYRPHIPYFFYTILAKIGGRSDRRGIVDQLDPRGILLIDKGDRRNRRESFVQLVSSVMEA